MFVFPLKLKDIFCEKSEKLEWFLATLKIIYGFLRTLKNQLDHHCLKRI